MKKVITTLLLLIGFSANAQPLQASFIGPWQWLILGILVIIIYRMIKSLLKVTAGNKGGEDRLEKLKLLRAKDLITEEEYLKKKEEVLNKL